MEMVKLEKWFMTRPSHGARVVAGAEKLLRLVELEKGQDFLEVGCGGGAVCRHVADKYGLPVTGVDVDPEMLAVAREAAGGLPNICFLEADATKLPFPDDSFDIVLSFGVTHHIPNWLDALKEIKRVLRPGGYFIYRDLFYFYNAVTAWLARFFEKSYGATTRPALDSFIAESGLNTIYSSVRNGLLWYNGEFVFRKG